MRTDPLHKKSPLPGAFRNEALLSKPRASYKMTDGEDRPLEPGPPGFAIRQDLKIEDRFGGRTNFDILPGIINFSDISFYFRHGLRDKAPGFGGSSHNTTHTGV